MKTKLCRKCGEVKTFDLFYRRSSRPIGIFPWCKECMRSYQRNNREITRAAVTRYRHKNVEDHASYNSNLKKLKREHYTALENKRRAALLGNGGFYTVAEWNELKNAFGHKCLSCGTHESVSPLTADHVIPISKGGSSFIENIQPLCLSCNSRKHDDIIDYRRKAA